MYYCQDSVIVDSIILSKSICRSASSERYWNDRFLKMCSRHHDHRRSKIQAAQNGRYSSHRRPMTAISGVLKSPWAALSIRQIISVKYWFICQSCQSKMGLESRLKSSWRPWKWQLRPKWAKMTIRPAFESSLDAYSIDSIIEMNWESTIFIWNINSSACGLTKKRQHKDQIIIDHRFTSNPKIHFHTFTWCNQRNNNITHHQ